MPMLPILVASMLLLGPAEPPPSDGDILRGPEVPQDSLKPDRARKGGAAKAEAGDNAKVARPVLEQRVLFAALDTLKLGDDARAKVNVIRDEFAASVVAYEKEAAAKRQEIFEKRRKEAEPGKPPSEEFKKAMDALEAKRPKIDGLKSRLAAVLSKEEMEQLRTAYEDGLKRARAELTRRAEEERKKAAEERAKKIRGTDAGGNDGTKKDDATKDGTKKDGTKKDGAGKPDAESPAMPG